jgi:hypothetical protein
MSQTGRKRLRDITNFPFFCPLERLNCSRSLHMDEGIELV